MPQKTKDLVQLRACNEKDISLLSAVGLQSYQEHYLYLWTAYEFANWYMQRSFSEESLHQQMQDKNTIFYLVVVNGKNAGLVKLNKNKDMNGAENKCCIELERLYLLKETTGTGVGKKAVQQIIQSARSEGYQTLWLKSMDSSTAVSFYQKLQFKILGREVLPYDGFKDEYRGLLTLSLNL